MNIYLFIYSLFKYGILPLCPQEVTPADELPTISHLIFKRRKYLEDIYEAGR